MQEVTPMTITLTSFVSARLSYTLMYTTPRSGFHFQLLGSSAQMSTEALTKEVQLRLAIAGSQ